MSFYSLFYSTLIQSKYSLFFVVVLTASVIYLLANRPEGFKIQKNIINESKIVHVHNVFSWLVFLTLFSFFAAYFKSYGFFDHVEASVASISSVYSNGQSLYPALPDGNLYGILYGPLLFQIGSLANFLCDQGVCDYFDRSYVIATKIPGCMAAFVGLYFCFSTIRKSFPQDRWKVGLFTLVVALAFLPIGTFFIWSRPEPFLFLMGSLAIYISIVLRPSIALPLICVIAGMAASLKLHAPVYFLVPGVYVFLKIKSELNWISTTLRIATAFGVFLLALFLPFLGALDVVLGYINYIILASTHKLLLFLFVQNISFVVALIVILLSISSMVGCYKCSVVIFCQLAFITAAISLAIVASKDGAGTHHFLPLIPSMFILVIIAVQVSDQNGHWTAEKYFAIKNYFSIIVAAALVSFVPGLAVQYYKAYVEVSVTPDVLTSIESVMKNYPDAEVGAGSSEDYWLYINTHPHQVASNHKLTVDVGAYMDLENAKISDQTLTRSFLSCSRNYWIIPGDSPWSMSNFYTNQPLFSEITQNTFLGCYTLSDRIGNLSVWKCTPDNEVNCRPDEKSR